MSNSAMVCMYCACGLRGMADTRMVDVNGYRVPACIDIDACNERRRLAELEAQAQANA